MVDEGFIYTNTKVTDEKSDNQFQLGSGLNLGSRWGLKGYGLHLGAKAPIAAGTLTAGLYYVDAKEDLTADADQDFKYYGVSARYVYPLSKRTSVYGGAGYGQTSVDNAAANGSDQDTKLVQAYVGLSHTF